MLILTFLCQFYVIYPPVLAASFGALIVFSHPHVACGVLQSFHVVAFRKIRFGEGSVDCPGSVGLAVGPHRVRRGLFQDGNRRRRTEVAAHAALFHH